MKSVKMRAVVLLVRQKDGPNESPVVESRQWFDLKDATTETEAVEALKKAGFEKIEESLAKRLPC